MARSGGGRGALVRRKARGVERGRTTTAPDGWAESAFAVASSCGAAAVGFDLCASRSRDETISVAARGAAAFLRSIVAAVEAAAFAEKVDVRPRARTCDRLRWEWIASTGIALDGAPERRLASECARILADVDLTGAAQLGSGLLAKVRLAAAEARSLAAAAEQLHLGEPAFAVG